MHALIINGSPRTKNLSNTDKILNKFTAGMKESGATFEQYEVSDKKQWEIIREKFYGSEYILIALPLFVECIPGLLLEFLETLPEKSEEEKKPNIAFILQSGFAEGIQLRCGEEYLMKLSERLGCIYGGTLVKGDNFSIRLFEGDKQDQITLPYQEMGKIYGRKGDFLDDACKKFTGPEIFPAPVRLLVGILFKSVVKKSFQNAAKSWGCQRPLDDRPYA